LRKVFHNENYRNSNDYNRKENQLNPALKSTSYAEDLEHIEIWCTEDADCHCMKRKTRSRLPCLVKMASEGASTEESDDYKSE